MTPVRLGLLGAGRIAQSAHLPAIAHTDLVQLVGLFDPSPILRDGVARRHDTRSFCTSTSLLADPTIEAVLIATPDRYHADLTTDALRAGKHVLVEKPLATTLAEATAVGREAEKAGRVVQVGAMKRHDPGVRYAAQAVRENLGRVHSATLWYRVMGQLRADLEATHFPAMIVDEAVRATEATLRPDRATYLLATHGAHLFDSLRHLIGDPDALLMRHAPMGDDHTWHGLATLHHGGLVHLEITASVHGEWAEGAAIHGERGTVAVRTPFPVSRQASVVEWFDEATGLTTRPVFGDTNPYKRQLDAFARAIRGTGPVEPHAADGLAAVRLIEAAGRSVAAGGAWVTP